MDRLGITQLMEGYSCATAIDCRVVSAQGEIIKSACARRSSFCQIINESDKGADDCKGAYLYAALQGEKLGEGYIYFCPYGLTNWAVPIIENGEMTYALVGGPVLMHDIDDLLLRDITKQNSLLQSRLADISTALSQIPVLSPTRVRHLADILWRLAAGLTEEQGEILKRRRNHNRTSADLAEVIHRFKTSQPGGIESFFAQERALISRVKLGDQQGARALLNDILGRIFFLDTDFSIIKAKVIAVMAVLARGAIEAGADLEIIFGLEYMYFHQMDQVENIEDMSQLLIKVLERFMDCTFALRNVKNRDLIFKAMAFIRSDFGENISLDKVANEVGLTPSYFSKLFKDETGNSYTEYLNQVRIEASKDLLHNGLSLAEVSQRVGFSDQSYFSKVFKRLEGVSPKQWKTVGI